MRQQSRTDRRADFDVETRIALLEDDVDGVEHAAIRLADEVGSLRRVLVGLLIAIASGSVIAAANIVVGIR